jgi:hypothetical protein
MLSELLTIFSHLQGELFFYLEEGPLKSRLVESYKGEEGSFAEFLEFDHQASILLRPCQEGTAAVIDCRLEARDFKHQVTLAAGELSAEEISELVDLLRPLCPVLRSQEQSPVRKIIRKKKSHKLLDIAAAAKALGLSQRQLKSLIPCSETRIVEEDGAKRIEEYYWDRELIARFEDLWSKQQNGRGYNREDLSMIAASCCDGDRSWARDCIDRFIDQRLLKKN